MSGGRDSAEGLLERLLEQPQRLVLSSSTSDPLSWPGYRQRLTEVQGRTGVDESVLVVRGRLRGSAVEAVLVVWEFGFLGGSVGSAAGERVARAFEVATEERLPVVLAPATGGSRMQEGMASLAQMAATTVASHRHAAAGLLQVAYLRHPTTGGVFASHANLADVVLAEPGATIGFAGPRVARALTGGDLPEGSHTAEGALAAGLVDALVDPPTLGDVLGQLLAWPGPREPVPVRLPEGDRVAPGDPWEQVRRARAAERRRAGAYLAGLDTSFELRGDRAGSDDPAVRVVLARLHGRPVVVVATDRAGNDARVTPAGYRKVWRGLELAGRIGVPMVTLVDTPGADAGAASEAGGVAHHIAGTFERLLASPVPVVSAVIGEGGSGGALALSVGDRLLIQEHAVFSVIAPEGAAAILERDAGKAPEVARHLDPTAQRLAALGIADEVVPEPAGAEVAALLATICRHLDDLAGRSGADLRDERQRRWRAVTGAGRGR